MELFIGLITAWRTLKRTLKCLLIYTILNFSRSPEGLKAAGFADRLEITLTSRLQTCLLISVLRFHLKAYRVCLW